jgi:hypothetical protein
MGDAGNTYDSTPPTKPTPQKSGPSPVQLDACKTWLVSRLTPNPDRVRLILTDAQAAGYSVGTAYRAKDALGVEEYEQKGKWWKLPAGAVP